jgi:hypothetical protein
MKQAADNKQWAMNHCLAEIGIHHPEHRKRAVRSGERLDVLIDYPASSGCMPPYAPMWNSRVGTPREQTQKSMTAPRECLLPNQIRAVCRN